MEADEAYALEGARNAASRLAEARYRSDVGHAAAEAATWISALDERCGGKDQASAYVHACTAAGKRELMQGMRYVRNQAVHDLVILPEQSGGMVAPIPFGLGGPRRFWQGKWAPHGQSAAQRAAFVTALAGRGVDETIADAIAWLEGYVA